MLNQFSILAHTRAANFVLICGSNFEWVKHHHLPALYPTLGRVGTAYFLLPLKSIISHLSTRPSLTHIFIFTVHSRLFRSPSSRTTPYIHGKDAYTNDYLLCICVKAARSTRQIMTQLTKSNSCGKSPPLLIPLFIATNCSGAGLSFTLGLWRDVFSMMMAKLST